MFDGFWSNRSSWIEWDVDWRSILLQCVSVESDEYVWSVHGMEIFLSWLHWTSNRMLSVEQRVWIWQVWFAVVDECDLPAFHSLSIGNQSFFNGTRLSLSSDIVIEWWLDLGELSGMKVGSYTFVNMTKWSLSSRFPCWLWIRSPSDFSWGGWPCNVFHGGIAYCGYIVESCIDWIFLDSQLLLLEIIHSSMSIAFQWRVGVLGCWLNGSSCTHESYISGMVVSSSQYIFCE